MRRRLTYANVTATVALFFAISGGALAASHYLINSTRQINPKVLKVLKGRRGATGATGARGKEGLPGNGGPAGKEGRQGEAGPFVRTLPSGKTLSGAFQATDGLPAGLKGYAEATISFAFPLATKPNVEVIPVGGKGTEHCPGSAEAPAAAGSYLCLYTMTTTGAVGTYNPSTEEAGSGRNGVIVFTSLECKSTPCNAHLVGTWAVTAP